jgi:hypothetical protein
MSSAIFAYLKNGRIKVMCNEVCEMLQNTYSESALKKKKQVFTSGISVSKTAAKTAPKCGM